MSCARTVWLLIALFIVGCSGPPRPDDERPEGHRRMLGLLAEVEEQSRDDNPYLGDAMARRIRSDLGAATPATELPMRWLMHISVARRELRLGREQVALEHYLEANRLIEESADPVPPDKQLRTLYETGVAYMRLAETANCVAHHTADSCIFPIRGGGVHVDPQAMTEAVRYLERALALSRGVPRLSLRTVWLLNIAQMTLGRYPQDVPEHYRIPPERFESDQPFARFEDVAPSLGLNSFDLAGGVVVEDLDGDGWLDIITSTSDTAGQMRYYRNDGRGGFEERTRQAGLEGLTGGLNLTHADYDNDGDADVLVLRGGWWRHWGMHPNSLLRNDGRGVFTDVTFDAGLGDRHFPTQTAAWADYDLDGDLDLYIGNETDLSMDSSIDYAAAERPFNVRAPNQLFRNEGDGTFTDVAAAAGVENLRYAKAVAWGDYDDDRYPDIFVSNMGGANRLYHNNGDGTFTDVAEVAGVARPFASFPAWFWDMDNDGRLDLYVSAYGGPQLPADVYSVAAGYLGLANPGGELARLYRGDGAGGFVDVAPEWGVTRTTLPMGANYGDLDNDGYPDVYLGTGYPYFEGLMPNVLYRNLAGRGLADVTAASGLGHLQKGHGIAFADLDNDGDRDLFAQLGGAFPGDAYGNALFLNPGADGRWIRIRLVGVQSNRSAIGTRLRLTVSGASGPRTIHDRVTTGGSFGSSPLEREIGLGDADGVQRLEVYWPRTDQTQRFDDLGAGQWIEIREGQDAFRVVERQSIELRR